MSKNDIPAKPVLVPDPAALRRRLAGAEGVPAELWAQVRLLHKCAGNGGLYAAFCHLATGEKNWAALARQAMLPEFERHAAADTDTVAHLHTWCAAAPLTRLMIAYDWVADSGVFTAAEQARIADVCVDFTWKHPFSIARSRVPAADNQLAAMACCCATAGWLFGVRRGSSLRARQLLDYGLERYPELLARLPEHGYSLEGSVYFAQIFVPVMTLFTALAEEITGRELASVKFAPGAVSLLDVLRLQADLVGPSGMLPPWDNYGWLRQPSLLGLAFLAARTGDAEPLKLITRLRLHREPGTLAWGHDDRMWSLLFWPETATARPAAAGAGVLPRPWARNTLGGALVAPARRWRLLQAWDRCGRGMHLSREQVNPNAIILEAAGVPLFTDGLPKPGGCPLFSRTDVKVESFLPAAEVESLRQYTRTFRAAEQAAHLLEKLAPGLIGASNSIVVNGEDFYAPPEPRAGRLTGFADSANLQAVAAETADYYRPRYPVTSMQRTSILIRDEYFLVTDLILAKTPLRFDWQVFARGAISPGAGNALRLLTQEQVAVDILPLNPAAKPELAPAPGFPAEMEGASTRIRYGVAGRQVELPFVIVPHDLLRPLCELDDGWAVSRAGEAAGRRQKLFCGVRKGARLPLAAAGFCGVRNGDDAWVWAGRDFRLNRKFAGKRLFLVFEDAVRDLHVWLNGEELAVDRPAGERGLEENRLARCVVEVTGCLGRDNSLVVAGMTLHGKLVNGAVRLCARQRLPRLPRVAMAGPGRYTVARGAGRRDEIVLTPAGIELNGQFISTALPPPAAATPAKAPPPLAPKLPPAPEKLRTPQKDLPPYARRIEKLLRQCVGGAKGAELASALQAALADADWRVQAVAALELGKAGVRAAIRPLLHLLENETPERIYAGLPAGGAGAAGKIPAAARLLAGKRQRLKCAVIEALGMLRAKTAVPALCRALLDGREFYPVHSLACQALGRIGDRRALAALEKAAEFAEYNTRANARDALGKLRRMPCD